MVTDDKIREAYENTPRCASDGDYGAFEAGYRAALSSLEQVGFTVMSGHGRVLSGLSPVIQPELWEPLYRIAQKEGE